MSVLVTGAGRGVGRAIAEAMAPQGPVALLARSAAELGETAAAVRAAGGEAFVAAVDVTDLGGLRDAVAAAEQALGPVDVLVNNAGTSGRPQTPTGLDPAEWQRVLDVNVLGPVRLCSLVLPGMVARGRGYVVNVTSLQGSQTFPGHAAYGASKAALMRFTDTLASDLAGTRVVVFDVSPGLVRTAMTQGPELAPLLAQVGDQDWTPAARAGEVVRSLTSGRFDGLSGAFVHAEDDLEDLLQRMDEPGPDWRRLRMTPAGPGDPLFAD